MPNSNAPTPAASTPDPAARVRSANAASRQASTANAPVPCVDCVARAELQAVILYPALGTPLVAPIDDRKLRLFLLAEDECQTLFGLSQTNAPHAWYFINKHLRLIPFAQACKTRADLKGGGLYTSEDAARKGIRVWYHGQGTHDRLVDRHGQTVANLRPSSAKFFAECQLSGDEKLDPAFPPTLDTDTANQPLRHLFEIELDFSGLAVIPAADTMYTLAWMVTCVYKEVPGALTEKVSQWEHQDKLVYDFFHQMQRKRQHFAKPFAFDLSRLRADVWPPQLTGEANRIKAYHPVIFHASKPRLDIGHLSDIHVSSRQFALAKADAAILEGISPKLGSRVANCLSNTKNLFDRFASGPDRVDALFLTGDLLDFNRNLDPSKVPGKAPKDQWALYNLAANVDNPELYPRGLDDMLMYSLVKHAYCQGLPVFMTSGNHEAYEEPYGISPRVNSYAAKRSANPRTGATTTPSPFAKAKRHEPERPLSAYDPSDISRMELDWFPDQTPKKANEGIPADHNLTIYEACLLYGPTFPHILQSWNHFAHNFDWFFTIFTPLADFAVPYNDQLLIGLEWGDGERMLNDGIVPGGILPRALEPISERQKALLAQAIERDAGQRLLFSHFTYVNFDAKIPFSETRHRSRTSPLDSNGKRPALISPGDIESLLTAGTFERNRAWLYKQLSTGKIAATLSGHSHRSGAYHLKFASTVPSLIEPKAHAPDKEHVPPDARILVSSCAGSLGVQNLCGELDGWNLMPPSGTRFEGAAGTIRTVTARDPVRAKPRFCVALDYVQCHEGKRVIEWMYEQGESGKAPRLLMTIRNVRHAVPFVSGVTFYVWNARKHLFYDFETTPEINNRSPDCLTFNCQMGDLATFARSLGLPRGKTPTAFAKVDFNNDLAQVTDPQTGARLYDQYNFSDPWIFRIECKQDGTIINHPHGETPDWTWVNLASPSRYPKLDNITQMKRPSGR